MAKKKRATKNQFQKGKSGNPYGRPAMTPEEKALSLKSRTQLKNVLNKFLHQPKAELSKLLKNANTPVLDKMIIKSMINTMESGDQSKIDWFLNHVLGRQKELTQKVEFSGQIDSTSVDINKLSKADLLTLREIAKKSQGETVEPETES
jgi:hypothetical protein